MLPSSRNSIFSRFSRRSQRNGDQSRRASAQQTVTTAVAPPTPARSVSPASRTGQTNTVVAPQRVVVAQQPIPQLTPQATTTPPPSQSDNQSGITTTTTNTSGTSQAPAAAAAAAAAAPPRLTTRPRPPPAVLTSNSDPPTGDPAGSNTDQVEEDVFYVSDDEPTDQEYRTFERDIKGVLRAEINRISSRWGGRNIGGFQTLYKGGTTAGEDTTTIVIVCNDDLLRARLESDNTLITFLDSSRFPFVMLHDSSLRDTGGNPLRNPFLGCNIFLRQPESSVLSGEYDFHGQALEVPGMHGLVSRCTLGGFIEAEKKLYGLTVGHLFEDWIGDDEAHKPANRRRRSISSTHSRARASTSESLQARRTTQGTRALRRCSPRLIRAAQDIDTSPYLVLDDQQTALESKQDFPYWTILGKLQKLSTTEKNDWALIELDQSLPYNNFRKTSRTTVSVQSIRASQGSSKAPLVTISTGYSGSHEGKLRIMSSVSWWFGKKQFDAYSIRLDRPLAPGDSGSLVMHNDRVCGLIVGTIDSLKTAFMIDIENVLTDIRSQLGCQVELAFIEKNGEFTKRDALKLYSSGSTLSVSNDTDRIRHLDSLLKSLDTVIHKEKYEVAKLGLPRGNTEPSPRRLPKQEESFWQQFVGQNVGRATTTEVRHVLTPGFELIGDKEKGLTDTLNLKEIPKNPSSPEVPDDLPQHSLKRAITGTDVDNDTTSRAEIDEEERQVINNAMTVLALHKLVERPQRKQTIHFSSPHFTFVDIARYIIRQQRVMKIIQNFLGLASSHLCKDCEALDLRVDDFVVTRNSNSSSTDRKTRAFVGGSSSGTRWLGSLRLITVKSLWCSLCRLISSSIREQEQLSWIDPRAIIDNRSQLYDPDSKDLLDAHCGIVWSVDGIVKSDDADDSSATGLLDTSDIQICTRRLEIIWDDQKIQSSNIILSASSARAQSLSDEFLGSPSGSQKSLVSTIQTWISTCNKFHDSRCHHPKNPNSGRRALEQPFFMVVDLFEMRLTSLPHDCTYTALSYLWGGISGAFTRRSNVRSLQARDGIQKIHSKLARTIQDAFDCARNLGERYIWVDALCIIRDSETSQRLNASIMHQIYANSYFTICAASSTDMQGGLYSSADEVSARYRLDSDHQSIPAFPRPIKQYYQPLEEQYSHNVRLMASYPAKYYIKKSPWFRRAWAFAESVLSPRSVIFVDGHVFFQCRTSVFRQDVVPGGDHNSRSFDSDALPVKLFESTLSRPLETYGEMVERYTRKELSSKHDILSAFWGIGSYLDRFLGGDGYLYGLPRSHFDCAILWRPKAAKSDESELESLKRGRHRVVEKEHINEDFPSWSWARHINTPVRYDILQDELVVTDVKTWIRNHTWIIWFVRDRHGNLTPVWHPGLSSEPDRERKRRLKTSLGYGGPPPPQYNNDDAYSSRTDIYGRPLTRHLPTDNDSPEFSLTLPEFPARPNVDYEPAGDIRFSNNSGGGKHSTGGSVRYGNASGSAIVPDLFDSELPLLQFWTYSAWFALQPTNPASDLSDGAQPPAYMLVDNSNELRGFIRFDSTDLAKQVIEQSRREAMGPHYRYRDEGMYTASKSSKPGSTDRSRCDRDTSINRGTGGNGGGNGGSGARNGAERPVLQFIAISEAYSFTAADEELMGVSYQEYVGTRLTTSPKPWSVFFVLLVVRQGDGVHRRVGLGRVEKEAFRYSCRGGGRCKWEEFILG